MALKILHDTEEEVTKKTSLKLLDDPTGRKTELGDAWRLPTTEEWTQRGLKPWQAAGLRTISQLSSPIAKGFDTALLGLPERALREYGKTIPSTEIPASFNKPTGRDIAPILDKVAQTAGFIKGVGMKGGAKLGTAATKGLPSATIGQNVAKGSLKGAITLGVASGAYTSPEEAFDDWRARGGRTAAGAVGGGVFGAFSGAAEHLIKTLSNTSIMDLGKGIRKSQGDFSKKMKAVFEKALYKNSLKYPGRKVDISKQLESLPRKMEDSRKMKSLVNASPKLRKAINQKGELSLKQTQDLVNELKETVSQAKLAGRNVRPSDREIMQFIGQIQAAKHTTFPAMIKTDAWYGRAKAQTGLLEKFTKLGNTEVGFRSVLRNPATQEALKKIMTPEIYESVKQTALAQTVSKGALRVADYAVRYGIIYSLIHNLIGKMSPGDDFGSDPTNTGI